MSVSATIKLKDLNEGALRSNCLKAIYDLKVDEILNKREGFMSIEEICKEINKDVNKGYLQRVMRYMSCFDLFEEKYENNTYFFKTTDMLKISESQNLWDFIHIGGNIMDLLTNQTQGKTLFKHVTGFDIWDFLRQEENKDYNKRFETLMKNHVKALVPDFPKIASAIKEECKENAVITDVGGLSGQVMHLLHKELPTLQCINFDLPEVIANVEPLANVKMVAGDMFKVDTLPKSDIIFTKYILHDWSDEKCIEFLKNFHQVLPDEGIFMSLSSYVPETQVEDIGKFGFGIDMTMLIIFGKPKERTLREYKCLFQQSGFQLKRTVMLGPKEIPFILMIATKA